MLKASRDRYTASHASARLRELLDLEEALIALYNEAVRRFAGTSAATALFEANRTHLDAEYVIASCLRQLDRRAAERTTAANIQPRPRPNDDLSTWLDNLESMELALLQVYACTASHAWMPTTARVLLRWELLPVARARLETIRRARRDVS